MHATPQTKELCGVCPTDVDTLHWHLDILCFAWGGFNPNDFGQLSLLDYSYYNTSNSMGKNKLSISKS